MEVRSRTLIQRSNYLTISAMEVNSATGGRERVREGEGKEELFEILFLSIPTP